MREHYTTTDVFRIHFSTRNYHRQAISKTLAHLCRHQFQLPQKIHHHLLPPRQFQSDAVNVEVSFHFKLQHNSEEALPSSGIDKSKLSKVEKVVEKYRGELKAGTLGPDIMLCTPVGSRDKPVAELGELKKAIFAQFPQF